MSVLQELQRWYCAQCECDWENGYGLTIDTLDSPGWQVTINLNCTPLASKIFPELKNIENEQAWIRRRVKDAVFEGHGGPLMLEEILRKFYEFLMLFKPMNYVLATGKKEMM